MVTICAMTATIMQALDTTIANVALPYMQGTLSASQDQINWVLTSYIVAAAIMTAPVGWVANRFGRKRIFIICSAGFTVASVMCGLAQDIGQMVVFRLLQGVFGAALVPLSQAVMLDSYALHERAKAMAIWGMGVMMGPIMGPSLGAWLTGRRIEGSEPTLSTTDADQPRSFQAAGLPDFQTSRLWQSCHSCPDWCLPSSTAPENACVTAASACNRCSMQRRANPASAARA
jgi:MFS family permease